MARSALYLFLVFVCAFVSLEGNGQKVLIDTAVVAGAGPAVDLYHAATGKNTPLFSGHEYPDYPFRFSIGHPYFSSDKWTLGTVTYQGITYEKVPLLYNLVTDNLIILNDSGLLKIQLVKEQVKAFSLGAHQFIHVCTHALQAGNLKCGFYDVLESGKATLLARRTKNLQTVVTDKVQVNVAARIFFFIGKNGVFKPINSRKDLLHFFADQKEVQRFIKKNRIRYRSQPERALTEAVAFYNGLKELP